MIRIIGANPQIEAMYAGKSAKKDGKSFCIFCEKNGQVLEHGVKKQEFYKRFQSERSFKLSPSMFVEARDYFHANFNRREDIAPVLDSKGNAIGYLYLVRNRLRDNSIYQGIPAVDFWDYDFKNKPVNDFVLNWADSYVFSRLEEYTYAIARYIMGKFPDRSVYFLDSMANLDIWGSFQGRVKVIDSFYDLPENCRHNCMQIITSEYNAYNDHAPESKNLIYNSVNIMYSMLWGSHIVHPGSKYADKIVVRIDNKFASVGLVDIIKITMNIAYQAEMQGYVPVADISQEGCCQYWEPGANVWEELFKPLSDIRPEETSECANLISARSEERGWLVSDWRSNPLWREADYRALAQGKWEGKPYLSDKTWEFVKAHTPNPLRKRIQALAETEAQQKKVSVLTLDDTRILGVIVRGTDYRKEACVGNEKNANNASVEQMLGWCKDLMAIGGYNYLFLATEDEDYFRLFKEAFPGDKLLYVDQPRVHLDLSLGKRITTDVLFKDKKVAGLELARLYLTALKCLVVCDDLISSMDNGTYRQVLRWNAGKYGLARIVKDGEALPVSAKVEAVKAEASAKPKAEVSKLETIKKEATSTKENVTSVVAVNCQPLLSDRRRALWVEGNLAHLKKPDLLRTGDFFISNNDSDSGSFLHGAPVCAPEALHNLEERPVVLLLLKDISAARKKLLAYGYVEGEDFLSINDIYARAKAEEKNFVVPETKIASTVQVKEKPAEPKVTTKPSEKEKTAEIKPVQKVEAKGNSAAKPKITVPSKPSHYDEYLRRYGQVTELDKADMAKDIATFAKLPLISIIMPVYNPQEKFFRLALDSVLAQVYPRWELCMADDASSAPHVKRVIEEYRQKDARIRVVYRSENGHICKAENSALELASGEFTALMDHDDILQPEALYCVAKEINTSGGEVDMIYTDMDYIDGEGHRSNPRFGGDFDPIIFASWNNVAHLDVYRTSILREIGGFRPGYEGGQDHDMTLRFVKHTKVERIHHIPHVCYSLRSLDGEERVNSKYGLLDDKESSFRAVKDYYTNNENTEVLNGDYVQAKPKLPVPAPLVSMIIPTKDKVNILKDCVESILSVTDYPAYEIIIIDNRSEEQETKDYFKQLRKKKNVRVCRYDHPFNHSALCNFGVKKSKGECYLFLNNDTKMMEPGWLTSMIRELYRQNVGIVGAKLLYGNGKVQHGGIGLRGVRIAHHPGLGTMGDLPGYLGALKLTRQCSAVTGACLLMKREAFEAVHGWDEENLPESFNDVDLCLRARKAGWQVVFDANAVLYHLESISRGHSWNKPQDKARLDMERKARHIMMERHGGELCHDPFYNPNLSWDEPTYRIAKFPSVSKPWRPWIEFVCPFPLGEVLLGIQVACHAYKNGVRLRMHVAAEYMPWLSDFRLPFTVLSLPVVPPNEGKSEKIYKEACEYVASLPDSSGLIVGTSPKESFERDHRLNIVEYMLSQFGLPIGEKVKPFLPEARKLDVKTKALLEGKTALLQVDGDQKHASIPQEMAKRIVDLLHQSGFRVIQIGMKKSELVPGVEASLFVSGTVGFWCTVFEEASLVISADSWVSQMMALFDIPHVIIYGETNSNDYYSNLFFEKSVSKSLIFDDLLLDDKVMHKFCLGLGSIDKI